MKMKIKPQLDFTKVKPHFASTFLVPMPKQDNNYSFYWLGTLENENERVDIIAFNCDNKNGFIPLLKSDLSKLLHLRRQGSKDVAKMKIAGEVYKAKLQEMRNIKRQIRFIERTIAEMNNPVFVKSPSEYLLKTVSNKLKAVSNKLQLTRENTIYITRIDRI